jgi:HAD superfamily hydrolase (TIGR01509 family)
LLSSSSFSAISAELRGLPLAFGGEGGKDSIEMSFFKKYNRIFLSLYNFRVQMKNGKYSVIVSDLGNVILPFDYNIAINKLEMIEKGLGRKFYEFVKSNYDLHRKNEKGAISTEEFIRKMVSVLDNKVSPEEFCNIYSKIFIVNEELVSLLASLGKNYKMVILSNTNKIHKDYGWGHLPFLKHFDKLILSYEVHSVKPEPEIFKAVEAYTQELPEKHLFIDDIFDYSEAAKKLGWDAIHYKNNNQLVEELKKRNVF